MTIGSEEDLLALKRVGGVVSLVRDEMQKAVRPGMTTGELDMIGETLLNKYGARSAPRYEYDFPGATCISVNDEVAHGIPGDRVLQAGDLVNIDVSAELNSYFADTGATVVVGNGDEEKAALCNCSKRALDRAIFGARAGSRISGIGRAIQNEARENGYKVIRNLTGHGVGRRLHEEPDDILNYFEKHDRRLLTKGLVLAIESFVSSGAEYVIEDRGGWILRTPDKSLVAQFEHTIVVTDGEPVILT